MADLSFKDLKDTPAHITLLVFGCVLVVTSLIYDRYISTAFLALFYVVINYFLHTGREHESLGEYLVGSSKRRLFFYMLFSGISLGLWMLATLVSIRNPMWLNDLTWWILGIGGGFLTLYFVWISVLVALGPAQKTKTSSEAKK